jgi:DNA repair exonuclease SbcCD nuclease subunit
MGNKFRFLHCADLHIGSAFTGLSRRIPQLDAFLPQTPFLAWHNTVDTAIAEKVDFVLIAGDCFDRSAPSLQGRLEFRKGLEKLKYFCYFNIDIGTCVPPRERSPYMTELDYIKSQIIEALEVAKDVDLLDLILKLLIAES